MPEGFPISLSPATVGVVAMALPFIALGLVQGIKGAFYWSKKIPARWKAALPDNVVWMGLAGVLCIGGCLGLKLDVGAALAGDAWPTWLPWWLSAIVSGIILTVLSSIVLYPLLLAPAAKAAAKDAVAAANSPPVPIVVAPTEPADPIPVVPSRPLEPPAPTPPPAAPVPTARIFLEVHQGGPDRFVLIEDETGQHVYPCS